MNRSNLEELLRSPLDDIDDPWPWWPLALAALAAAAVAAFTVVLSGGGETVAEQQALATTSTTSAQLEPEVITRATPFPTGFTQVTGDIAMQAEAPVRSAGRLLVPVSLAVRRGVDPADAARPLGGRWVIQTDEGAREATAVHYDRLRPGTMAIEFPPTSSPPTELQLVEVWVPTSFEQQWELPWDGEDFVLTEPLEVDLDGDAALRIETLELRSFLGELEWALEGADLGVVEALVSLRDADGGDYGDYAVAAPSLDPELTAARVNMFWPFFNARDTRDAASVVLTVRAQIGEAVAADVVLDVPSS